MKRLILMRHAKSDWSRAGQDDFDRELDARGQRDAPLAGTRLARFLKGEIPHIIASPAIRARATATAAAQSLGCDEKAIEWNDALYLCEAPDWLEILRGSKHSGPTLMSVGHNPGITALVNHLGDTRVDNMPTASIAALEFSVEDWQDLRWGGGRLVWFDYPKLHLTT